MDGFWFGAFTFVVALASGFLVDAIPKLPPGIGKVAAGVGLVISISCAGLGVHHALNWGYVDIFSVAHDRGVPTGGGKRGVALVLVMFWPFVMICMGLLASFLYWKAFRRRSARPTAVHR
ncbi:hypothetical protein JP74_04440 [Devosia sp. 17-2-E-8]|nr:hypothetical protein JP74_04440 [Devosia sp. 17-2-E-8]